MTNFWQHKKVLVTGHTGFKGSWLCLWLMAKGAHVIGFAQSPSGAENLFEAARVAIGMTSILGDVGDFAALKRVMDDHQPEIVFHLAAQALVRYSYQQPRETFATNVMGTVHLLEAIRQSDSVKAVVNVTSDKCYDNREWLWGYRENEPLGGRDPYSSSKACAELVTAAYQQSFFNREDFARHGVAVASARAGNVIGGGDWGIDRLVPDIMASCLQGRPITLRYPHALRPWQHVLEPLAGYLMLAQALYEQPSAFAEAWNFGPNNDDVKSVQWLTECLVHAWGTHVPVQIESAATLHEATFLQLDCAKAKARLQWQPQWSLTTALMQVVDWYKAYQAGADMRAITLAQIHNYPSFGVFHGEN